MAQAAHSRQRDLLIALALAGATLVVFERVRLHPFINLDDDLYVTENAVVQEGLTWDGFVYAFTNTELGHWHPVTWLSHMTDCAVYGLNPTRHHLTSLQLHLINTLLLFFWLLRSTGAAWPSAAVAALFALHPFHVEPVASVSSRKDLLAALLWLSTLFAYHRYVRKPIGRRYLGVCLLFALALMAKPVAVTLPFALLLLDYWPYERFRTLSGDTHPKWRCFTRLLWEKAPLFALAGGSIVITCAAARGSGVLRPAGDVSVSLRVSNVVVSYGAYLARTFYPRGLAVFYPYPGGGPPLWQVAASLAGLGLSSILAWRCRRPYVLVGWLWFVVTLIPVIGIVPVGAHVRADRYTYIPLIGLFIAVVWSLYEMALQKRGRKTVLATAALAALAVLGVLARMQAGYWRSAETLYAHALEVTRDNYLIHNNMATTLLEQGRFDEALTNLSAATRINPLYQPAQFNLGFILLLRGQTEDAIEHLSAAVRLDPNDVDSRTVLADALSRAGRHGEAVAHYGAAVRLEPENPGLHTNLGNELARLGNYEQAVSHYREALRLRPGDALAHYNLGLALEQQGLPAP